MGIMDELFSGRPLNEAVTPETLARIHPSFVPMRRMQNRFRRGVEDYAPAGSGGVLDAVRGWANQSVPEEERVKMIGDKPLSEQAGDIAAEHLGPNARTPTEMFVDWNPVSGPASAMDKAMRATGEGNVPEALKNLFFAKMAPDAMELSKQLVHFPGKAKSLAYDAGNVLRSHPIERFLEKMTEGAMEEGGGLMRYLKDYAVGHGAAAAKAAPVAIHHAVKAVPALAHPGAEVYSIYDELKNRLGGYFGGGGGE